VLFRSYWLGVETTEKKIPAFMFLSMNTPSSITTSNRFTIDVGTNYTSIAVVETSDPDGLVTSSSIASGKLTVAVTPNNTGETRKAVLTVTAGTMTMPITISQSPGENSYIFHEWNIAKANTSLTYGIPVYSANADGVVRIPENLSADDLNSNYETVLLYGFGNNVDGENLTGHIRFIANNGTPTYLTFQYYNNHSALAALSEGANVIGLKDNSTGKIVYSWMLWRLADQYNFDGGASVHSYNGYTYMDLPLGQNGASGPAPLYQWGRKDIFPDGFETYTQPISGYKYSIGEVPASAGIDSTMQFPGRFYYNPNPPFDWKRDGQHNNLWVTVDGEKGPFDPCPFGWRVPPAETDALNPWAGFTEGMNGLSFIMDDTAYDGTTATKSGRTGVWSSSPRNTQGFSYLSEIGRAHV
jgi:hypothetical protein